MKKEIIFDKYERRGADYHYRQINKKNIKNLNSYVLARYLKHVELIKKYLITHGVSKSKTISVLDVGCGDGVLLYLLKKNITNYTFDLYGVDLSHSALKVAKEKMPNAKLQKAGAYEVGFEDSSFDLIISSDVIEHVNFPEKMLAEIHRVAKKEALIIIGTPIRYTEIPLDKMHVQEFFPQEFTTLVSNYFKFIHLAKSHSVFWLIKYLKINKFLNMRINKYLINLQTVLGYNPFQTSVVDESNYATYMFVVCKK